MGGDEAFEFPIQARGLSYAHDRVYTLKNVDLAVQRGALLGLAGPAGAGKTTLLHICLGHLKPTGGEILVFGEAPGKLRERRAWIGYHPQAPFSDYPPQTPALEFVIQGALPPERSRRPRSHDLIDRAAEMMALTGAGGIEKRPISELSGVRYWRVCLARTLVNDPKMLILDELGAGLMTAERLDLLKRVVQIKEQMSLAVLIVTRDLALLEDLVPEVVCLNRTVHFRGHPSRLTRDTIMRIYPTT